MASYVLGSVFKKIYEKTFSKNSFDDRLEMQKAMYLLQELGISVGDYDFMWYKHGPYSQSLQNDILNFQTKDTDINVSYSRDAETVIQALNNVIMHSDIHYDTKDWAECLGSMQYLRENILPSSASDEQVIEELVKRKNHLNKHDDNKVALERLKELFVA